MKVGGILRRFLLPRFLITAYGAMRYGCFISPRAEVEISRNLSIGGGSVISSFTKVKTTGGPLRIGRDVSISTNCFLSTGEGGVEIGDKCMIGPNAAVIGSTYSYLDLTTPIADQALTSKGIRIEPNVWIGAACSILDGATIGTGSILTANTVVSGVVPPNSIVSGNPGKVIFERR